MSSPYEDALDQAVEAVRRGKSLDDAVRRFPEHAEMLREDVRLTERVAGLASAVSAARPEARVDASRRLHAQLALKRDVASKPRWSLGTFGWARYAVAAAFVAIALLGGGLLLGGGGGSTVEAATIEGVVVDNQDGTLTVQTLDALEQVQVPADTLVSDVAGASIGLGGIEAGQVVVVDLERRGREVVAQRVQRYVESLEAWCAADSARCTVLTVGLEHAQGQCLRTPVACRFAVERLEQLRLRASDSASLERLKAACRGGADGACRAIIAFCREQAHVCGAIEPELPVTDRPMLGDRLEGLHASCLLGDEGACRQLARACNLFADLCPEGGVERPDVPPTPSSRPNVAPRPGDATVTPGGDLSPRTYVDAPSPTPRLDAAPALEPAAPARDMRVVDPASPR